MRFFVTHRSFSHCDSFVWNLLSSCWCELVQTASSDHSSNGWVSAFGSQLNHKCCVWVCFVWISVSLWGWRGFCGTVCWIGVQSAQHRSVRGWVMIGDVHQQRDNQILLLVHSVVSIGTAAPCQVCLYDAVPAALLQWPAWHGCVSSVRRLIGLIHNVMGGLSCGMCTSGSKLSLDRIAGAACCIARVVWHWWPAMLHPVASTTQLDSTA